jgi:nucleotide-binding universal stress UspA family protein
MKQAPQSAVHLPSATVRDAEGRLVSLAIEYGLSANATGDNTWLVAIDGSDYGQNAVTEALRLAGSMKDCALHLVNVQHWMSKEAAESVLLAQGLAATKKALALLGQAGVPSCLHVVMGDAAESIAALAEQLGCHGIVIGSRGLGAAENLLLGSVAQQVIHSSRIAVLVVR